MPVERSAGIILFRNTPRGRIYLVIRSSRGASVIAEKKKIKEFWDLPKGILEKGEKGIDAARREVKEEVGIADLEVTPNFKETVRYFTWREGKSILKFAALFLAEAKTDKIKLSWEHDKYEWLPYKEARDKLTMKEMKMVLDKAEEYFER